MTANAAPMAGKIVVVTGGTGGIGAVTARALGRQGARVIIVGRNPERGEAVAATIAGEGGRGEFMAGDLSSRSDIHRLAAEIAGRCSRVDVLVNNAGAMFGRRRLSADGIEMTFAVNHLAYFLLSRLLQPLLEAAAGGDGEPARIVNVASGAHRGVRLDFDNLQGERRYRPFLAYKRSKLCNLYFTYELASRLAGRGITINALHPGFVATGIGTRHGFVAPLLWKAACLFAIDPNAGARTGIYLASASEVAAISGRYFYQCRPIASSTASYDTAAARQLWEISESLTAGR